MVSRSEGVGIKNYYNLKLIIFSPKCSKHKLVSENIVTQVSSIKVAHS